MMLWPRISGLLDRGPHLRPRRTVLTALCVFYLAGCSSSPGGVLARLTERGRLLADGPPARMNPSAVAEATARETPILYAFAAKVGAVPIETPGSLAEQRAALLRVRPEDWPHVTRAGQFYIDSECQGFMAALHDLERTRKQGLADLNALQSAAVGIMGLARVAQQAIGYVGISFGLVASLFDNDTSKFLYQLPAASVATIVMVQRDVLLARNAEALLLIRDQSAASAWLTVYVQYCTPITIEANVGKVLGNAKADGETIVVVPVQAVLTPTAAHGLEYKETGAARGNIVQQVQALEGPELLRLANLMLPWLAERDVATQAKLQPFVIPPGGPFTTPGRAASFVSAWARFETMTDPLKAQWSAAIGRAR